MIGRNSQIVAIAFRRGQVPEEAAPHNANVSRPENGGAGGSFGLEQEVPVAVSLLPGRPTGPITLPAKRPNQHGGVIERYSI